LREEQGGSKKGLLRRLRSSVGRFAAGASEIEVAAGDDEGGSDEAGETGEDAGEKASPCADVQGVEPPAHFDGAVLLGIGAAFGDFTSGGVEGVGVGGADVTEDLSGRYLNDVVAEGDTAVIGLFGLDGTQDVVPMGVGERFRLLLFPPS
jgi:hypothetical protein